MGDFPIKKDALLQFDALSIKQHIKERLNQAGVFTDQNFEGSYITTVIDIISYVFNTLLFYLNRTSSESLFTDSQIYENMNRIVKMLDYKPVGNQSAILSFNMYVDSRNETASRGTYTIPRYSYIDINGISYSFNEDITFSKTTLEDNEEMVELAKRKTLFQGKFEEFPLYTSTGQENEIIFLDIGQNVIIDHFNVHAYVKRSGEKWKQWFQTPSLYLENTSSEKFELRFNENKTYEIKFGNGINGSKLNEGDQVAIYYLESKGSNGEIGSNTLNGKTLIKFISTLYNQIIEDDVDGQYSILNSLNTISLTNDYPSTYASGPETVDSIRQNAPGIFRSQYRLVTQDDYDNYIRTNFANIIQDVQISNNWQYLSQYIKYYYDLGIANPSDISRAVYNQVLFADSCNFNNVYITIVPKTATKISTRSQSMLTASQKSLIIESIRSNKTLTSETIILDPVYMALAPAISLTGTAMTYDDTRHTKLSFIQTGTSRRSTDAIKSDVLAVFQDYFLQRNSSLGQEININYLTDKLLSINGVKTFYTQRTDNINRRIEGLTMLLWNPIYADKDIHAITQNAVLNSFQFPYLDNYGSFINSIEVITESKIYEGVEY